MNSIVRRFGSGHGIAPRPLRRLVCIPYAGGSARVFRSWGLQLRGAEVWACEYPGRGTRWSDPSAQRIEVLADEFAAALGALVESPIVLFGHSLGGLVAYEIARRLARDGHLPAGIIASGCRAPHLPSPGPRTYDLPQEEFVTHLRELNGTPADLLADKELLELMLPILRQDFRLSETYQHRETPPLACPIVALGGLADPQVDRASLAAWSQHTTAGFSLRMFPGGHFFLQECEALMLDVIERELHQLSV